MKRRGEQGMVSAGAGRSKRRKAAHLDTDGQDPDSQGEQQGLAVELPKRMPATSRPRRKPRPPAPQEDSNEDEGGEDEADEHPRGDGAGGGGDADADASRDGHDDDDDAATGAETVTGLPAADPAPDINTAATALSRLTGIPLDAALTALKETQERVLGGSQPGGTSSSSSNGALLAAWLDEAQIWLACSNEVQGEIEDVRAAMNESLQQYEAAKAADDMPLAERPPEYLRDRFIAAAGGTATVAAVPRSRVVLRLAKFACHQALFPSGGGHKAPLVKLAELESKCHRWYPTRGTERFWERLAEECEGALVAAAPAATSNLAQRGWLGCTAGPEACGTCAKALGKSDPVGGDGPSTSAAPAAAPCGAPRAALPAGAAAELLSALGSFASRKAQEVEQEVCKMPTISGQIPDVFAVLDDEPGQKAESDGDEIIILDSQDCEKQGAGREQVEV